MVVGTVKCGGVRSAGVGNRHWNVNGLHPDQREVAPSITDVIHALVYYLWEILNLRLLEYFSLSLNYFPKTLTKTCFLSLKNGGMQHEEYRHTHSLQTGSLSQQRRNWPLDGSILLKIEGRSSTCVAAFCHCLRPCHCLRYTVCSTAILTF